MGCPSIQICHHKYRLPFRHQGLCIHPPSDSPFSSISKIVYGYSYSFQDFRIPLFDYLKSIFLSLSCSTTTVAVASCIEVILESQLERTIVSLVYLEERHVLIIECKVPSAFV